MNKRFNWILAILIFVNVFSFMGCPKEPEINIYTVTFNANGGVLTSDAEQNILAGGKIINPSAPTRDGYSFTGWYTDQYCTTLFDINNNYVNNNFTLYAGWIRLVCTITFDTNNNNNSSSFEHIINSGDKILAPFFPTWDGYTFTGWYTDKECTILFDFTQPIMSSFTLYAGWTQNTYTITFNPNGGTLTSDANQLVLGGNRIESPTPPTREGYYFTGWYYDEYCIYPYNFDAILNSDATLYAGWTQNTYTVTFNPNGGILTSDAEQLVLSGNRIEIPTPPTREGYNFTGWYCDEYCLYPYNFDAILNSDATLYAGWTQNTYTITFNPNGGILEDGNSINKILSVLSGNIITPPDDPINSFCSFTGWYTDIECTIPYDFTQPIMSSFTLYAGWELTTYTVTFNANGGTLTSNTSQTVSNGSKITEPTNPTHDEYDFTGWYTDIDCTNKYDFTNQVTSNFTLYAGWEIKNYTVSFNANGGTLTSNTSQTVSSGSKITEPSIPTRTGYDFTGWYTNASCTNKYDFTNQVTNSFTLYAGWEAKLNTITFNANGGTLSSSNTNQNVLSGSKITQPTNPTYSGYTFTGWYTDINCTNKYNFENQITSSFTLYAGWEIKKYTVSFNANGGVLTSNTSQTVSSGSKVTEPSYPKREDYYFTGWYTSSNCTNLFNFNNKITNNITLYAGWKTLEEYIPYIFDSLEGEGPHDIVLNGYYTTKMNKLLVEEIKEISGKINLDLRNTTDITYRIENFSYCTALMSIKLPYGIRSIESNAFYGCTNLTSIEMPISVRNIGSAAFSYCTGLTNIEIPSSVTTIGRSAFYECTNLTSIEIPSSVTSIGDNAFYECTSLTSIEIPSSVTSIGDYAFYDCTSLTSVKIPSSVTSIGGAAFYYCTGLTSVKIPSSVTNIAEDTFRMCTNLTSIEIPTSVTSIGDAAFLGTGLKIIEIPTSVTTIGSSAFYGCRGLSRITFKDTTTWYYTSDSAYLNGTSISVTSSTTNATNLINFETYANYYWYKE